MKKIRILALVLAIFALTAMLFLVSCDGGGSSGGNQNSCEVNGHKWPEKWTSNGDATCTEDGTRSRKCPVCKEQQVETDPDTATGHFFVDYVLDGDATCTEDGHETAKCYICEVATDTRIAVDSALGHRWGSQPVSSVNGFDTLRCLREGCGVESVIDDGTIDEDFEHTDGTFVENTKRYVSEGATALIEGTDGKYLFLKRGSEKLLGNTAFGIFFTPDYALYKSKKYVFEYDLLITENTKDLDLLVGKKVNTEQVFATYDSETGKLVANGTNVWTVTKGEWVDVAFVIDDVNFVYDMYVDSHLVASQVVYSEKDTYYMPSDIDWLAVRMVAEPKTASEFGIDNIKTYVAKTIENPGDPLVKVKTVSTLSTVNNLYGDEYNEQWLDNMYNTVPDYRDYKTDGKLDPVTGRARFDKSFSVATVEKDGKEISVIRFENFSSGFNTLNLFDLQGVPKNDVGNYDLTKYSKIVFDIYSDSPTDFGIMFNIVGPDNNGMSYYGIKQVVKPGWNTYEIDFTKLPGATRGCTLDNIRNINITCSGWKGSIGVAPDYNGNPVDGYAFCVTGVYLYGTVAVSHVKLAENCEHVYGDDVVVPASCVTPGYSMKVCTKCEGELVDENSTRPMVDHAYETIRDIAATCTEPGYFSQKCTACNQKSRTDRAALGHLEVNAGLTEGAEGWVADYAPVVKAPTCYYEGDTTRLCQRCGESYVTDITAKVPHTWGEGFHATEDDKPTCTDDGVLSFECTFKGDGCDGFKTEVDPAFGHTEMNEGLEEGMDGYDPSYVAVYTAPTCTTDGFTTRKCQTCGGSYNTMNEETDKALGHNMVLQAESEKTFPATCYSEGAEFYICDRECCTNVNPDADEKRYNETKVLKKLEHTWPEEGFYATDEDRPTCVDKGLMTYECTFKADGCDGVKTVEVDAIGHKEVTPEADPQYKPTVVEPSCTAGGYTERFCSVCLETYKTDTSPMLPHAWGEYYYVETNKPTCTTAGLKTRKCGTCGVEDQQTTAPALGHDMVVDADNTTATCTAAGKLVLVCANGCGKTEESDSEALGHDWKVVTNTATCTDAGVCTSKCDRCGEDKVENVPALGHTADEAFENKVTAPTCTEEGFTVKFCSVCKTEYNDDKVAALGHKWAPDVGEAEWVIVTPATCYQEGFRYRVCLNGCESKSSEAGDEAEKARCVIKATGEHVWDSEEHIKDSTETEEGYYFHKCTTEGCPEVQKYGDPIPVKSDATEGLVWDVVNGVYYVIGYEGDSKDVVIPGTYAGAPVVVAEGAFYEAELDSVTFKGAVEFEYAAFEGCTIGYIVFSADITEIAADSFYFSTVTTVYYAGAEGDISNEDVDLDLAEWVYGSEGPNA